MNLKTWCLQIWGVNTLSCLQYENIIVDKNQSIPYFPPHCGIQCSIPSKVCPLRKRLPLSYHRNSSQIFDATKLWKHTIPVTYNTKTLISNISETHHFSPQMRLIAYPDHKTTRKVCIRGGMDCKWKCPVIHSISSSHPSYSLQKDLFDVYMRNNYVDLYTFSPIEGIHDLGFWTFLRGYYTVTKN